MTGLWLAAVAMRLAPMVLEKPIHRRIVDRMRALANDLRVATGGSAAPMDSRGR